MISFFESSEKNIFAVQSNKPLSEQNCNKLQWLFGNAKKLKEKSIVNNFIGPRSSMISPWSTNAVEMCENMGIDGIARIEKYFYDENSNFSFDPMTNEKFKCLDQNIFKLNITPVEILEIKNIRKYNVEEGLALSHNEVEFLEDVAKKIGRNLTDSEVFGFSQVNSEHCRHKIFNGTFIIDKEVKKESLFSLIKKTSKLNSKNLVSAYKDNVAFIVGPEITQFAPKNSSFSDFYESKKLIRLFL
jgi:phosphoribosylformylglycinamidine synthase